MLVIISSTVYIFVILKQKLFTTPCVMVAKDRSCDRTSAGASWLDIFSWRNFAECTSTHCPCEQLEPSAMLLGANFEAGACSLVNTPQSMLRGNCLHCRQ
ncbi:hypothetical protein AMECASPLE_002598 [Ameca splendens]|uniref:Secreted protein n=1 Tax=Ameca splendens TaxID=208324 RepID=A0ABV0YX17_9TELE